MVDRLLSDICTANDAGDFCLALPLVAIENVNFARCWAHATSGLDCSVACSAMIHVEVITWGCCVGVIQRVLGGDSTDDDDDSGRRRLLNFVAQQEDNSSSSEDSSDGFDFHLGVYLFEFQLCPDFHLTIVTLIDNACPKPRGSNTVEKSLTLQVPYDAFTANEGLSAQLTSSLAADLAVRMGVSTDCVTSVELTESDSVIADPLAGSGFAVTSDSGVILEAGVSHQRRRLQR